MSRITNRRTLIAAAVLSAFAHGASAQEAAPPMAGSGGGLLPPLVAKDATAPIYLGGVAVRPSIDVGFGYNDNVTNSGTNTISSYAWRVTPLIEADVKAEGQLYGLRYRGDFIDYTSASDQNIYSNLIAVYGNNTFTERADARWEVGFNSSADPVNTNDAAVAGTPNKWQDTYARGTLGYGARDAQGRLEGDLSAVRRNYTNNDTFTYYLDNDRYGVNGRFLWRVAPKTRVLAEVQYVDIVYDTVQVGSTTLDSNEYRYLVGVTWDATAKTTGIVKLGYQDKKYKSDARQDFSGFSWAAQMRWLPFTYSSVDLITSRLPIESTGVGNGILSSVYGVSWNHQWTGSLDTAVRYVLTNNDYQGVSRTDDLNTFGLTVGYRVTPKVKVAFDYSFTNRDSTDSAYNYDTNVYMLKANLAL